MAQILRSFPQEVWVVLLKEVAVKGGLSVNWILEVELLDNSSRLQVEL